MTGEHNNGGYVYLRTVNLGKGFRPYWLCPVGEVTVHASFVFILIVMLFRGRELFRHIRALIIQKSLKMDFVKIFFNHTK